MASAESGKARQEEEASGRRYNTIAASSPPVTELQTPSPLRRRMKKIYSCSLGASKNFYAKLTDTLSRGIKKLGTGSKCLAEEEAAYEYDLEDEAQRLLKEVKIAIEQVKESEFYAKLKEQIASDEFQEQLKSVLESHSKLKMVIYALGSLEFGFNPHSQLAIAILLEQDFSWIEGIEVYDPLVSSADVIVLKSWDAMF